MKEGRLLILPVTTWHAPFPPGYSAHEEAVTIVSEKAHLDVGTDVAHARACGCPRCYRRAEATYGWYTGLTKTLNPK